MTDREDRRLPNRYARHFMLATEDETGDYSLRMMLRSAGLARYVPNLPPENSERRLLASEYAALHAAIRNYYGSGARGSLNRIGRATWRHLLDDASIFQKLWLSATKILPTLQHSRMALNFLATKMREPDGEVSVHLLDEDLIFMDTSSDSTFGQTEDEPVCWVTLGMLQAALYWATGDEQNVEEISCRATGSVACRFRVRLREGTV